MKQDVVWIDEREREIAKKKERERKGEERKRRERDSAKREQEKRDRERLLVARAMLLLLQNEAGTRETRNARGVGKLPQTSVCPW